MSYPVRFQVEPPEGERNRLTVLFRPVLAIPHVIFVGGPVLGLLGAGYRTGVFGLLAILAAVIDWFAVLVTGHTLEGLAALKRMYLFWRARVLAYSALLRDEYPPFGEGPYPVTLELPGEAHDRDRLTVALRPILALPHVLVLLVLLIAWLVAVAVSWLVILFTGRLPPELWRFGRDVMGYALRLEAYVLLLHDVFPPFVLSEDALTGMPQQAATLGGEQAR
jgi:hypothetical protein